MRFTPRSDRQDHTGKVTREMPGSLKDKQDSSRGARKRRYRLSIRIYLPSGLRIGPGKIALLEAVQESGSISGAARVLKMSYKRAWDLLEELNSNFAEPVIATMQGGSHGGGAELTRSGKLLVAHYRAFERHAYDTGRPHLNAVADLAPRECDAEGPQD